MTSLSVDYSERAQRALDLAVVIPGSVIALPVCLVAAAAIRIDSPGPVIYRAKRCGRDGKLFTLYKLRTMQSSGGAAGPAITARHDSRITRVGRVLRRMKVDELPQLLNVLRGEMSLVGPRPEVPHIVDGYDAQQQVILYARPGITCKATIAYRDEEALLLAAPSDNVEKYYLEHVLPKKLATDIAYLRERTIGSDLRVLAETCWLVGQRCLGLSRGSGGRC